MNEPLIKDVLSWEQFFNESSAEDSYPPKEIKLFNRLIAHTNNFFIISAIGAFTPGYLMLISKELVPSFSFIEDKHIDELKWLSAVTTKAMQKTYDRQTVEFEHGMCACVGGLDRAHMHLMTISKNASENLIKDTKYLNIEALIILRLGYYEILLDEKVPIYAGVNSWVELSKYVLNRKFAKLYP